MYDFLFTIDIVNAEILEDYRKYLPGTNKPSIHWGVDYYLKYMGEDVPEQPGMLSRRFMEVTLKPKIQPTPDIIARELVMRGSKSVGTASQKARKKWWIEKARPIPKEPSIEEEVFLAKQVGEPVREDPKPKARKKATKPKTNGRKKHGIQTLLPGL
jgi:hypothetical protein